MTTVEEIKKYIYSCPPHIKYFHLVIDGDKEFFVYREDLKEATINRWGTDAKKHIRKVFVYGEWHQVNRSVDIREASAESLWDFCDKKLKDCPTLARDGELPKSSKPVELVTWDAKPAEPLDTWDAKPAEPLVTWDAKPAEPLVTWDAKTGIIHIRDQQAVASPRAERRSNPKSRDAGNGLIARISRWLKGDVVLKKKPKKTVTSPLENGRSVTRP